MFGGRCHSFPIVTDSPSTPGPVDVDKRFPEVFVSCAVTHAMSKSVSEVQNRKSVSKKGEMIPGLSFFLSVSHQEWLVAQREDATLKEMFSAILSPEEVERAASGCFVE